MSNLWSLVKVLGGILAIWKQFQAWLAAQRKAETTADEAQTNKGLDEAKTAKTPEEAYAAEDDAISNKH